MSSGRTSIAMDPVNRKPRIWVKAFCLQFTIAGKEKSAREMQPFITLVSLFGG